MTTLGDRIKQARTALGLTQREVAAAAGMSQGMLYMIEQGKRIPKRPDDIAALAAYLHISSDQVYAESGVVPPDILAALTGNLDAITRTREALGLVGKPGGQDTPT